MANRKDRRNSGRVTPKLAYKLPVKQLIAECLEPQPHWDDWNDWRDGMRWKPKPLNPFRLSERKKRNRLLVQRTRRVLAKD